MPDAPAPSPSLIIEGPLAGRRLDAALGGLLPDMGVRARRRLIARGGVLHNGRPTRAPGLTVRRGDEIRLAAAPSALPDSAGTAPAIPWTYPARRPEVLGESASLVFLLKPAGLHTAALRGGGAPSLEGLLPALLPGRNLRLLQRLDWGTSGLVCAAASPEAEAVFRDAEARNRIHKGYVALLRGCLDGPVTVRAALAANGGATVRARSEEAADPGRWTLFSPLIRWTAREAAAVARALGVSASTGLEGQEGVPIGPLTLAVCRIGRGARHQIRAHAAWLGLPLWGDVRYGGGGGPSFFLHHGKMRLPGSGGPPSCPPFWLAALEGAPGGAPEAVRRWMEEDAVIPTVC